MSNCRAPWTDGEDVVLLKTELELGRRWSEIARRLKGRSENAVKNRFNALYKKYHDRSGKLALQDVSQALKTVGEQPSQNTDWALQLIAQKAGNMQGWPQ